MSPLVAPLGNRSALNSEAVKTSKDNSAVHLIRQRSISNRRKYMLEHVGQLIIVGLAAQLLVAQVSEAATIQNDLSTSLHGIVDASEAG